MALVLLIAAPGLRAQTPPAPYDPGYKAWKLERSTHAAYAASIRQDTVVSIGSTTQPSEEMRGGITTCDCWIAPDASYSLAMPPNDDLSSAVINLPFQFYLYGNLYSQCYINNNGNVTFNQAVGAFSAGGFPAGGTPLDTVMVAPFWADVETTTAGQVWYKVTPTAMYVNWVGVGYYFQHSDKVNTFQLIITDGTDPIVPNGANVSFCYRDMQWTTGDASQGVNGFGGTPATVGANKGDGINYIQFGRFDHAGIDYDGPFGNNDGVSFLDFQHFSFSTDITLANVPPVIVGQSVCDSLILCVGQPGILDFTFLSPEPDQITTPSASAPTLSNFNILSSTPGLTATISAQVIPTLTDVGFHVITFSGTDNGVPPLTSTASIVVHVLPSPILPPGTLDVCASGNPVDLYNSLGASAPAGGTWVDPNGAPHSSVFVPGVDINGTYVYSADTIGNCPVIGNVAVTSYTMHDSTIVTNALCHGIANGSMEVLTSGNGGPWNYTWTDMSGNVVQTTNGAISDTFTGTGGTYEVHIAEGLGGNGCLDSLTATITEPAAVSITAISNDTTICRTGGAIISATAQGGTGALTLHWNNGSSAPQQSLSPLNTTQYSVYATDSNNCPSDTLSMTVTVLAPLGFALPDTLSVCPHVDLLLVPTQLMGGDSAYQFDWGSGFQQGPDLTVNIGTSQQFCVTLTDGCETPDVTHCVWIDVTALPPLILTADTSLGCDPFAVRFTVVDTTGGATVDWDFGDGVITSGPPANVGHTYGDPGHYNVSVVVHWPNGCNADTTITQMITVEPVPHADFSWNPDPASIFEPDLQFTEHAGPFATSFVWDFAGLDTSHHADPEFTFPNAIGNTFAVTLVAANYLGCTDTVTKLVELHDEFELFIPNAFTPDGDGINETFGVTGNDISTKGFDLLVFDRWGEVIFESTDRLKPWDASVDGAPVKDGVYAWRLFARSAYTGLKYERMGHVTVFR